MLDKAKSILRDLIAFPTVSADSNLELIAYVSDYLASHGANLEISHDDSGRKANLFATIGPDIDGGVVLSGHTDVVPANASEWQSDPFKLREADGRLYGRGACDMKGFIAVALAMAGRFAEAGLKKPIHYALTYDEEVGCLGARKLVDELALRARKPALAIVGEPTGLRIVEGHKGCFEYTTEFHGLGGHGSQPDLGVNAIEYANRFVTRLLGIGQEFREAPPPANGFQPPWTTVQVGCIEGGSARNVIAETCVVEWEMRPVDRGDAEYVKAALADFCERELLPQMRNVAPEAAIRTTVIGEVDGLAPVQDNAARTLISELTGANDADVVAFGTEAGLFQRLGMSVVVCGPGSIEQAHKPDEFVEVEQLARCLNMLDRLAEWFARQR